MEGGSVMSMMPIYKVCPRCRRRYLWNPDTGQTGCPNCGGMKKAGAKALGAFLKNVMKK